MKMGGMNEVETRGTETELHATARESVSPIHYYRTLSASGVGRRS